MAQQNLFQDLFILGALSLFCLFMLNLAGKIITPFFPATRSEKPYFNFFIESLIGFTSIITLGAILAFGVYTVNIITLLFFLGFLIHRIVIKKELGYRFNGYNIRQLAFVPLIPFITIGLSLLLSPDEGIQSDVSFYCRIAESFSVIDKENFFSFFNFHGKEFNGTMPYHYVEMHFGAFVFKLFDWTGYTHLVLFKYVVYGSLKALVFIGLLALAEKFRKPGILEFILMILLICIDFVFITNFDDTSFPLYTSMWMRPNFIIYNLFLISVFYFLFEKNLQMAGVMLLLFLVLTLVVAPPVLMAAGAILLWLIIYSNEKRPAAKRLLLLTILLAICFAAFYKLTAAAGNTIEVYSLSVKQMIQKSFGLWKAIVGYVIKLTLRLLILLFIAFIPILLLGKRACMDYLKSNAVFISFVVLLPLSGILIFQAVPYLDNMYQFPYVGYVGCYLLFIFNAFYAWPQEKTKFQKVSYGGVLTILILAGLYAKMPYLNTSIDKQLSLAENEVQFMGLNKTTVTGLTSYFTKNSSLKGGSVLNERDIKEVYMAYRQNLTAQLGFYLMNLQDNTNIESLSNPADLYPDTDLTSKDFIKTFGFNKHTLFYKNYTEDSSYIYNLKRYIDKANINYLILSKRASPDQLPGIKVKKYIRDLNTGHQILILE